MSTENKVVSLQLTQKMLKEAPSGASVTALPAVQNSWIEKRNLATGTNNGATEFQIEQMIFAARIAETPKLANADRFSIYQAWMMHAVSGLSFRDDQAYILPYKTKAVWQPGWKGRLAQIQQWPSVVSTTEPQIVYSCDEFEFETTMEGKRLVKPHRTVFPRPAGAEMVYVFMIIRFNTHSELYTMDRDEVNLIRDQYSEAYKFYMSKGGKWDNGGEMDKPLALSNPAQYWRKTLVKRIYNNNNNAKTAAQKVLDAQLTNADILGDDPGDSKVITTQEPVKQISEADYHTFIDVNDLPAGDEPVLEQETETVYTELPEEVKQAIAGANSKPELKKVKEACSLFDKYRFFTVALNARLEEIKAVKNEVTSTPTSETDAQKVNSVQSSEVITHAQPAGDAEPNAGNVTAEPVQEPDTDLFGGNTPPPVGEDDLDF